MTYLYAILVLWVAAELGLTLYSIRHRMTPQQRLNQSYRMVAFTGIMMAVALVRALLPDAQWWHFLLVLFWVFAYYVEVASTVGLRLEAKK